MNTLSVFKFSTFPDKDNNGHYVHSLVQINNDHLYIRQRRQNPIRMIIDNYFITFEY